MKRFIIISILVFGCTSEAQQTTRNQEVDTVFLKSDSLAKEAMVVLPKTDKQVHTIVEKMDAQMDNLKAEIAKAKNTKTIIRDTIYITEKKNFWGKKKTTVDSSGSVVVDSLEN